MSPERRSTFAAQLAAARRHLGLTQRNVAAGVGYDSNTVARWERGERTPHVSTQKMVLDWLAQQRER